MTINQQPIQSINSGSVRDQVYERLKNDIVNMKILPGTALSENEMAMQYNVSRTPIRESFLRLAQEGLVQVLPQRGTLVSLIDIALVEEARFMRNHLELAIVELACEQFSPQTMVQVEMNLLQQQFCLQHEDVDQMFILDQLFHALLFEGVNKTYTWHTLSKVTIHLDRSRKLRLLANNDWKILYEQHCEVFQAIKDKQSTTATTMMKQHLTRGIHDLIHLRKKYPTYFTS